MSELLTGPGESLKLPSPPAAADATTVPPPAGGEGEGSNSSLVDTESPTPPVIHSEVAPPQPLGTEVPSAPDGSSSSPAAISAAIETALPPITTPVVPPSPSTTEQIPPSTHAATLDTALPPITTPAVPLSPTTEQIPPDPVLPPSPSIDGASLPPTTPPEPVVVPPSPSADRVSSPATTEPPEPVAVPPSPPTDGVSLPSTAAPHEPIAPPPLNDKLPSPSVTVLPDTAFTSSPLPATADQIPSPSETVVVPPHSPSPLAAIDTSPSLTAPPEPTTLSPPPPTIETPPSPVPPEPVTISPLSPSPSPSPIPLETSLSHNETPHLAVPPPLSSPPDQLTDLQNPPSSPPDQLTSLPPLSSPSFSPRGGGGGGGGDTSLSTPSSHLTEPSPLPTNPNTFPFPELPLTPLRSEPVPGLGEKLVYVDPTKGDLEEERPQYDSKIYYHLKVITDGAVLLDTSTSERAEEIRIGEDEIPIGLELALMHMQKGEVSKFSVPLALTKTGDTETASRKYQHNFSLNNQFTIYLAHFQNPTPTWKISNFEQRYSAAIRHKELGNVFFGAQNTGYAVRKYYYALDIAQRTGALPEGDIEKLKRDVQLPCFLNLAQCHRKSKRFNLVIEAANQALSIDPTNCKAFYRRALGNTDLGNYIEAEKDFERALNVAATEQDKKSIKAGQAQLKKLITEQDKKDRELFRNVFTDTVKFYNELFEMIKSLISDETDLLANTANVTSILHEQLNILKKNKINWTGFYWLHSDGDLVLGPFQGKVGCTRIKQGRGVCGAAVENRKTMLVPDVHKFKDHIACDSASNSEIVIPIIVKDKILGVLDIDSVVLSAFGEEDQLHLEKIVHHLEENLPWSQLERITNPFPSKVSLPAPPTSTASATVPAVQNIKRKKKTSSIGSYITAGALLCAVAGGVFALSKYTNNNTVPAAVPVVASVPVRVAIPNNLLR